MRMWMVNPKVMCRQHLLGEHVEIHMLIGTINRGISIKGFLDSGLIEPQSIEARHQELVEEMERRGYKHKSPLKAILFQHHGTVNKESSLKELSRRCNGCNQLITKGEP